MKKSESQNIEEEESHRYSTVSSAVNSEYLYAAPTMGEFMSFLKRLWNEKKSQVSISYEFFNAA